MSKNVSILWNVKWRLPGCATERAPTRLHKICQRQEFMPSALWRLLRVSVFYKMRNSNCSLPLWTAKIICRQLCCRSPATYTCSRQPPVNVLKMAMHAAAAANRYLPPIDHRSYYSHLLRTFYCPSLTYSLNFIIYNDSIKHRFIGIVVIFSRFRPWPLPFCFVYITSNFGEKIDFKNIHSSSKVHMLVARGNIQACYN